MTNSFQCGSKSFTYLIALIIDAFRKMVQCTKCISLCGGFHSLDAKCLNILLLRFRHIPSLMDYFALYILFHRSFSFSLSNRYIFQAPLYSHFSHAFTQETIAAIRERFKFRHRREFLYLSTKLCVFCSKNVANKKNYIYIVKRFEMTHFTWVLSQTCSFWSEYTQLRCVVTFNQKCT